MTMAPDRRAIARIEADVEKEIARVRNQQPVGVYHPGPRCRICSDETSRIMVNKMLANGIPTMEILETAKLTINPKRAKNRQITYDVVRWHAKHHFNVEEPAKAAYRNILERRAAEQNALARVDDETSIEGIARLITVFGYLDVMAHRGYETLVKDDTVISPMVGMEAIVQLHRLTRHGAGEQEAAELRQRLAVVESAVKEVVPPEYWSEIVARIEDGEARVTSRVVEAEVVDDYDDYGDNDEPYSPPIEADADDTLEG